MPKDITQITVNAELPEGYDEEAKHYFEGRLSLLFAQITNLEEYEKSHQNTKDLPKDIIEARREDFFENTGIAKEDQEAIIEGLSIRYNKGWMSYTPEGVEETTITREEFEKHPEWKEIPGIEDHIKD